MGCLPVPRDATFLPYFRLATNKGASDTPTSNSRPMIGDNRQLVADEPGEFEKSPVEVGDCRRINYRSF